MRVAEKTFDISHFEIVLNVNKAKISYMRYVVCICEWECTNKSKSISAHCSASVCLNLNVNVNANAATGSIHVPIGPNAIVNARELS